VIVLALQCCLLQGTNMDLLDSRIKKYSISTRAGAGSPGGA